MQVWYYQKYHDSDSRGMKFAIAVGVVVGEHEVELVANG